jgi:hypothetical protein
VLQADVSRADERRQPAVGGAADFDDNFMVEGSDGDFVELLARQAEIFEVGRADDLAALEDAVR